MISVLVVDDDFRVAHINRAFVDGCEGFEAVATAQDAASAIALTGSHQPDLILLDIYLPDRSGLDAIGDLRAASPDSDIMIVSAAREAATIRTTVRQGVVDYLLKPFTREMLTARLSAYARRRRSWETVEVRGQDDVDRALRGSADTGVRGSAVVPKGLSPETARLVADALAQAAPGSLSAREAGDAVGISRVSARRYLEWLVGGDRAEVELRYGGQGRPERRYRARE